MEDEIIKQFCLTIVNEGIKPPSILSHYKKYNEKHRLSYITTSLGGLLATSFSIPFIIDKLFNNRLRAISFCCTSGMNFIVMSHYNNMIVTGMLWCIGSILMRDLMAYLYNKKIYSNFLRVKCNNEVSSELIIGEYHLNLLFKKSDDGTIIDGPSIVLKQNKILFKGTIKCDGLNCELIRDNKND